MNKKERSAQELFFVLKQDVQPLELDILSMSAPEHVIVKIAMHPSTPARTLARLASHHNVDVRCAVGENINTPVEILRKLAKDGHPDVRYSLAENHNLGFEILRTLITDENPYVENRAQRTMERVRPTWTANSASGPISATSLAAFVACA